MRRLASHWTLGLPLACALAAAPALAESADAGLVGDDFDTEASVRDPWEGLNRATFSFNELLDRWLLEPVARGWDFVVPEAAQEGLDNFLENLAVPRHIVNDLLQGKPAKAGDDLGRFLINTSFGLGGFFDPAGAEGFPVADEDFGQTLGVWGSPPGPYLVLPLLGPSSPRDAAGMAVDSFVLSPENYYLPIYVTYPRTVATVVNSRSLALERIEAERAAALDFYAAVRNAYVSFRANQVRDRADAPEEEDEDFYYFDEEE
jgi:phospholipid-binding lipoprotein MlaA